MSHQQGTLCCSLPTTYHELKLILFSVCCSGYSSQRYFYETDRVTSPLSRPSPVQSYYEWYQQVWSYDKVILSDNKLRLF